MVDAMSQHQVRIMNFPEPPAEELYVRQARAAHAQARDWADQAVAAGLEELLFPAGRPVLKELIAEARARILLSGSEDRSKSEGGGWLRSGLLRSRR